MRQMPVMPSTTIRTNPLPLNPGDLKDGELKSGNVDKVGGNSNSNGNDTRSSTQTQKNISQSLKFAKQALAINLADPESWYVVGNAYMSSFFAGGSSRNAAEQELNWACGAYDKAEKLHIEKEATLAAVGGGVVAPFEIGSLGRSFPDLYYNRASLRKYRQDFQPAIDDYRQAATLDPSGLGPQSLQACSELELWVQRVSDLVDKKGGRKGKRLKTFVKGLDGVKLPQVKKGAVANHEVVSSVLDLEVSVDLEVGGSADEKRTVASNTDKAISLKVLMPLGDVLTPPSTFLAVDSKEQVFVLSIYNLGVEFAKILGGEKDVLTILEPRVRRVGVGGSEGKGYLCIEVADPNFSLLLNGGFVGGQGMTGTGVGSAVATFGSI
jgi:tetratricopeptide (TPR) repeat protein